jgi:dolichol-phosphate mannosyltransferase
LLSISEGAGKIAELTVIVPTYNERDNINELVDKLDAALEGISWEVLFVDDNSPDGTADLVRQIGIQDPRVRCLLRINRRGLSSACIEGMSMAESPYLAVMDADLQHDEAILSEMLEAVKSGSGDVAVGSRYTDGGGTGDWGLVRRLESRFATWICSFLVPGKLTDPMSGFFVIRRETFMALVHRLSGRGFKILLDIFASAENKLDFVEIPYTFRLRHAGESKLTTRVAWEFLELILEKTVGRFIDIRFALFTAVGATGVLVHLSVLGIANQALSMPFAGAQALAIITAMTSNFALNNLITYRDRPLVGKGLLYGLLTFYAACSLGAVVNYAVAVLLSDQGANWALAGFAGAAAGAVWNFATTAVFTWGKSKPGER